MKTTSTLQRPSPLLSNVPILVYHMVYPGIYGIPALRGWEIIKMRAPSGVQISPHVVGDQLFIKGMWQATHGGKQWERFSQDCLKFKLPETTALQIHVVLQELRSQIIATSHPIRKS